MLPSAQTGTARSVAVPRVPSPLLLGHSPSPRSAAAFVGHVVSFVFLGKARFLRSAPHADFDHDDLIIALVPARPSGGRFSRRDER